MYRHSLHKRVAIAFAMCVAVLSIAWGFAFFAAIRLSEDRVLTQQLQVASDNYPAITTNLKAYDKVDNLPQSLQAWAQTNPAVGLYEFDSEELHVAVIDTGNEQSPGFVVFDVAQIEASSSEDWWLLLIISSLVGTLGLLGFGLGIVVMRRALAPVTQLAKAVADINPEQLSNEDYKRIHANRYTNDEVGMLASTIEQAFERVSAFIARERYFTDSASHELRTPVTVITGALELLEQSQLTPADMKVLDRVRRATHDMNTMIEMFLCLARETDDGLYDEQFLVMPLVRKAVEQQRYLLNGKLVGVELDELANPIIYGHAQAFSIAINNLVRNAFEHTLAGQEPIAILIKEHELLITNQFSDGDAQHTATETASHGYGLGLGIVQRLCERNGWSFSLHADTAHVVARLSW
ncbi:HAMP domain-containing sensor histidine kinase [Pseudoalteromonas sp. B5MOD-1]|uniref:sensor histidine kinase n=1 Tax=Pseudoalteromonas TaxID=53246 RepID=UPI000A68D51C|nr:MULTISPECIES: HAMP domain-containing sensor histidine kinase [Pseudoalteromonas]MCO7207037.1 HAMP domain-containing histidine kinase [Pseudoalteromonas sp. CnMc7-37]MCZ4252171.1 HAMP domain-containing sensor histidine kinase [Pseudoalteromonas shioyasakiensis]